MKLHGNTILITGGGSGIGRGLAEAFHALGNTVIVSGRRKASLDEVTTANPGITGVPLDIQDRSSIASLVATVTASHPALNVLINNAGVMLAEDLHGTTGDVADAESMIATNLLGPIRLTAALMPHLRTRDAATIINVSSGLAFVPLAMTPTYSATKAALHSYSQSLRVQLRDTAVQVIELAPPAVATDLMPHSRSNPQAMTLDAYIQESMALLKADPEADEICVHKVKVLRDAEREGRYADVFAMLNGRR